MNYHLISAFSANHQRPQTEVECFYRVNTDLDGNSDQKSWNDKHHDVFLNYKEQNYQVDLTRNQIRPTTDIRVAELMKNSKPCLFHHTILNPHTH